MDLTDELEQSDSGMESLTASKDDTPERRPEDYFISSLPSVRNTYYILNAVVMTVHINNYVFSDRIITKRRDSTRRASQRI